MKIVKMTESDFEEFWPIFKDIVESEETYAFDPNISYSEAIDLWLHSADVSFAAKDRAILGSYFLKKNASGPGSHVANCGYMVAPFARGKGVAKEMCIHSQQQALSLGYSAMQFNCVVSSNHIAIELWKKLGFKIIGTIPQGYKHRKYGFIDTYIMHKMLARK